MSSISLGAQLLDILILIVQIGLVAFIIIKSIKTLNKRKKK